MGYTHYWNQLKDCPKDSWQRICKATEVICEHAEKHHSIFVDKSPASDQCATIDSKLILVNGVSDQAFETFVLTRRMRKPYSYEAGRETLGRFNFCKTSHKPYDTVVTAILCVAHYLSEGVWEITSDGRREDWAKGLELARTAIPAAQIPDKIRPEEPERS